MDAALRSSCPLSCWFLFIICSFFLFSFFFFAFLLFAFVLLFFFFRGLPVVKMLVQFHDI